MMVQRSFLEQLGEQRVPQRPAGFGRKLHQRINVRLTGLHMVEVAVCLLPYTFVYFFEALFGAVGFSLTGRYPDKGEDHAKRNDPDR